MITQFANFRPQPQKQLPANGLKRASLMDAHIPGYGMGMPRSDFTTEVLYHKLLIAQPAPFQFTYAYASGSGRFTSYTSIEDFINDLKNNPDDMTPDAPLYNMVTDAPNIQVKVPCYVVIELVGAPTMAFWPNHSAIDTASNWSDKYCALTHYDTSWEETPDNSSGDPCYLISFGVQYPATSGNDPFNFYFQFGQSGQSMYLAIDPAIKNRGPHKDTSTKGIKPLAKRD